MKSFGSISAKYAIAVLMFMVALAVSVYSQELTAPENAQTTDSASEETTAIASTDDKSDTQVTAAQTPSNQATTPPFVFPTRQQRFKRYAKNTVGPFSLLRTSISAGISQWRDKPEEWEQGASGYGKRFASSFGKNAIHHTVIYGLDSALGLDTGFRKSPQKGFGQRFKHALLENITSRTRSGKRVIAVPRLAGYYTSNVIARETWYPERYSYKDGLRSGTRGVLTGFALNLVREFVVRF